MEEDKRAEAMRKAIAESDALAKKESKPSASGGADVGAAVKTQLTGAVSAGKSVFSRIWSNKTGRIGVFAAAGIAALLLVVTIVSSIFGGAGQSPVQYEITDAVLCVYESSDVASGYAYDAYVEVMNTGSSDIYLTNASFMIQDERGDRTMIDTSLNVFPAVIGPGEKGYIFNRFGAQLTGVYDPEMSFFLVPSFSAMHSDVPMRSYEVSNVSLSENELGLEMTGSVMNDTNASIPRAYVVGICYDANGRCIGLCNTFVENIEPHVSVGFRTDPVRLVRGWANQPVMDYKVYAY